MNSDSPLPLASYSEYWRRGRDNLLGDDKVLRPKNEDALYFFKQYGYMEGRIDAFRNHCKDLELRNVHQPHGLPGVVVIGTPGIGEPVWPLYPSEGLTAFLTGKTSFLNYYLARELSMGKPVIYIKDDECYIFKNGRVYVSRKVPHFGKGFLHTLCLVDADIKKPAPPYLLNRCYPFLLMAASPRKEHYSTWVKQRARGQSRIFVLNPPEQDELVKALV